MPNDTKSKVTLPEGCSEAAMDLFRFLNQSKGNPFKGTVWDSPDDMIQFYVQANVISEEEGRQILAAYTLNLIDGELAETEVAFAAAERPLPGSWT